MPNRSSKRPTDGNQLAKLMVEIATGNVSDELLSSSSAKNPAAVALGKLGGQRGGKARADKLTPEKRKEIAVNAAAARWKRDR